MRPRRREKRHCEAKEEGEKALGGQGGGRKGIVRPRRREKRHWEAKEEGEKAL